jgi:CheY-like chemotaxis protein/anti-sigma regulatory factor (Ser/Thr protein kinase)
MQTRILVVDDDETNRLIVREFLEGEGYDFDEAADGEQAWTMMQSAPRRYDVVLLDRMMPGVDGVEVLRRMKGAPDLVRVPVILQTAAAAKEEVLEGLREGAFYYLTKPFEAEVLQAIVRTAVRDSTQYRGVIGELERLQGTFGLMDSASFRFRTLEEARNLAALVAGAMPDAAQVAMGLSEILVNAVEHGNLGISYEDKSRLLATGGWQDEVEARLASPRYGRRYATLEFKRGPDAVVFRVIDAGAGFDWRKYLELDPMRVMDAHGRGIAIARRLCFDSVDFRGRGNEVVAVKTVRANFGERLEGELGRVA